MSRHELTTKIQATAAILNRRPPDAESWQRIQQKIHQVFPQQAASILRELDRLTRQPTLL